MMRRLIDSVGNRSLLSRRLRRINRCLRSAPEACARETRATLRMNARLALRRSGCSDSRNMYYRGTSARRRTLGRGQRRITRARNLTGRVISRYYCCAGVGRGCLSVSKVAGSVTTPMIVESTVF